ncbi:MAG: GNAT family N-acetyltransferase [Chloroflexi bacterium]|jgi:RimJ/RimL family protein N-acetyltransferase|nr:GNAT family protein [Anaerolineaceae bacterium]NMB89251.1 GNAT family N-acetyltransferase [Chloroflexota bacterium]
MNEELLRGELVYLRTPEPEKQSEIAAQWLHDSEYWRLADCGPAVLWTPGQQEDWLKKTMSGVAFMIHTLEDDHIIGSLDLTSIDVVNRNAWLGIGIGERQYWGGGYGSDALRIILRYGFQVLNLNRISLNVYEYNPRAIRAYEKVGFVREGALRQWIQRDGQRWDLVFMSVLRQEWEA